MTLTLGYGSERVMITYKLQGGDRYVEKILKLFSHAKIFLDAFCLGAELPVYLEGVLGVDVRHLEVMFWG
jgi:hypothetical protein